MVVPQSQSFKDFIDEGTTRNRASLKSYKKMFSDVADLLLNKTVFNIGSQRFKIFEIEFYVNDFNVHYDTFA